MKTGMQHKISGQVPIFIRSSTTILELSASAFELPLLMPLYEAVQASATAAPVVLMHLMLCHMPHALPLYAPASSHKYPPFFGAQTRVLPQACVGRRGYGSCLGGVWVVVRGLCAFVRATVAPRALSSLDRKVDRVASNILLAEYPTLRVLPLH
jgi:hypothetical protein